MQRAMATRPNYAHRRNRHPPIALAGGATSLLVNEQLNSLAVNNPIFPNYKVPTYVDSIPPPNPFAKDNHHGGSYSSVPSPSASPHISNQKRSPSFTIHVPFASDVVLHTNTTQRYLERRPSSSARESLKSQASSRSGASKTRHPQGRRPHRKISPEGRPLRCTRFNSQVTIICFFTLT